MEPVEASDDSAEQIIDKNVVKNPWNSASISGGHEVREQGETKDSEGSQCN